MLKRQEAGQMEINNEGRAREGRKERVKRKLLLLRDIWCVQVTQTLLEIEITDEYKFSPLVLIAVKITRYIFMKGKIKMEFQNYKRALCINSV